MMIDDECPFENILNPFSNYNRTLQGSGGFPPNRSLFCLMLSTICSDYCDLPLGSYKKKSQEEPRQDLWSSRKKISIDHVAPQVGHKYQTMIEHMYAVLTLNIYSLSSLTSKYSSKSSSSTEHWSCPYWHNHHDLFIVHSVHKFMVGLKYTYTMWTEWLKYT